MYKNTFLLHGASARQRWMAKIPLACGIEIHTCVNHAQKCSFVFLQRRGLKWNMINCW